MKCIESIDRASFPPRGTSRIWQFANQDPTNKHWQPAGRESIAWHTVLDWHTANKTCFQGERAPRTSRSASSLSAGSQKAKATAST